MAHALLGLTLVGVTRKPVLYFLDGCLIRAVLVQVRADERGERPINHDLCGPLGAEVRWVREGETNALRAFLAGLPGSRPRDHPEHAPVERIGLARAHEQNAPCLQARSRINPLHLVSRALE